MIHGRKGVRASNFVYHKARRVVRVGARFYSFIFSIFMDITINYLAVLVGAISNMIIGFLWYGPIFGKMWMALMGFTEEKMKEAKAKGMGKSYALMLVGALVTAYVLAHFVAVWGADGVSGAFQLAFWAWLGFIAPVLLGAVLWEGKSWKLYVLNMGYYLVTLFVMAMILVMWK